MNVRRLGYALGAEISGVDLFAIDEGTVEEIRKVILDAIVVVFPGQPLAAGDFRVFCERFGELDDNRRTPQNRHPDFSDVMVLANKQIAVAGHQRGGAGAADKWHTDLASTTRPTTLSFLNAKALPEAGGDTLFANQYAAYDALTPAFREMVDGLWGIHDLTLGPTFPRRPPDQQALLRELNPPVAHPVAKTHPETGRTALYVGEKLGRFAGMSDDESRPLRDFLNAHATRYEMTYRHRWTLGDLVIWDNRCALHAAVADYDTSAVRWMLRCSLLGPECGRLDLAST